ncbi:hypothetical protein [Roseibium sp. MMSF_3544]|uniref:hypothetical protein n=1 Tax=unclassified Roseibium TaxID=2629323 RepID=UPI0027401EE1|nr:hypothetical protein [Roseibium sp. MMSF_3544]
MSDSLQATLVFDWFRNLDGDRGILRRNINWVFHYFSGSRTFSNELTELTSLLDGASEIMHASGLADTHHSWARVYEDLDDWPRLKQFFLDGCGKNDVLVGFELSPAQRSLISSVGKTYLDIRTHPVRFLPDYMLAANTNSTEIHDRLVKLTPERSYIDQYVGFVKARAARRYTKRMNTDHGIVFFSQIAVDSSRIRGGEIIDDFFVISELVKILDKYKPKNFYVKHHPHEKIKQNTMEMLRELNAKEINTNTYDLLSCDGLLCAALSSSVCHEAQYFKTRPHIFLEPIENFSPIGTTSKVGDYMMLPSNIYSADLWRFLLEGGETPRSEFPRFETPYRSASGLSWG